MRYPSEFRKKPVVIEAMQWNGTAEDATEIINWVLREGGTANYFDRGELVERTGAPNDEPRIAVRTLEGRTQASPGDWIIRGTAGEFYPCRNDIFTDSYEGLRA